MGYIPDVMTSHTKVVTSTASRSRPRQASSSRAASRALDHASRPAPWVEAFDAVPVPLWIIGADANVWYGNRAWHDVTTGTDASLSLGIGWLQSIHEDDRIRCVTAFDSAAALRTHLEIEIRLRSGNGYRWWSFAGAPHYTPAGEVESFIGAAHDTTVARHAQQRLRDLGAKLVAAQEVERGRIARELHDDLAQRVALLAAKLGVAADTRPFSPARVRQNIEDARSMLQELAISIHVLAHELHPPRLKLLDLGATLKSLCEEVSAGSRVPIQFTQRATPSTVSDGATLCIFRVAQEALQNATKHSAAQNIDVTLGADSCQLTLRIVDDGSGFDPVHPQHAGLGLVTMRERVELAGGRLQVISEPGRGTVVEAIVPYRSEQSPSR